MSREQEMEICDFCGTMIAWGDQNEKQASIWSCEQCGRYFCSDCFKKIHGPANYQDMVRTELRSDAPILCPDCYEGNGKEH